MKKLVFESLNEFVNDGRVISYTDHIKDLLDGENPEIIQLLEDNADLVAVVDEAHADMSDLPWDDIDERGVSADDYFNFDEGGTVVGITNREELKKQLGFVLRGLAEYGNDMSADFDGEYRTIDLDRYLQKLNSL
jgi:hypothetical protein